MCLVVVVDDQKGIIGSLQTSSQQKPRDENVISYFNKRNPKTRDVLLVVDLVEII